MFDTIFIASVTENGSQYLYLAEEEREARDWIAEMLNEIHGQTWNFAFWRSSEHSRDFCIRECDIGDFVTL